MSTVLRRTEPRAPSASRAASADSPATISGSAPGQRRHSRAQQADRPGPEDDDGLARPNRGVHAHRVVGHGVRLDQAGQIERQRIGNLVQARAGTRTQLAIAPSTP